MRILLVSDIHHFSTLDVYNGYVEGFRELNIPFDVVDLLQLQSLLSLDVCWGLIMAKALNVEAGFTDIVFIPYNLDTKSK